MSLPTCSLQPTASSPRIWIKICGLGSAEGVAAAVAAGVDAVGFVFHAPSKRYVQPAVARRLASQVPAGVLKFAVMLHPSQAEVDRVLAVFQPDVLQTDDDDLGKLKLPSDLAVIPVLRNAQPLPRTLPPRLLFEGPVSGTGATADWSEARSLARRCELILAGGLHPGNVEAAIRAVQPFGVDVSSGVESSPGVKDPLLIQEFVRAARRTERRGEGLP